MNSYLFRLFRVSLLILAPALLQAQSSPEIRDQHVSASLVGEMEHLQPGKPYRLGLLLRHDPGWHTYWKSSTTGYATTIEWDLPPGFTISGLTWPGPEVYDSQGIIDFVHTGEVLLTATLTPPADLDAESVTIGFSADWLMCEKACVPGGASSELVLPVNQANPAPSAQWSPYFAATDASTPAAPPPFSLNSWTSEGTLFLRLTGDTLPQEIYFFSDNALVQPKAAATPIPDGSRLFELRYNLEGGIAETPDRLTGALQAKSEGMNGQYYSVSTPLLAEPPEGSAAFSGTTPDENISFLILLLAFAGGLVLNLMPCVFPVLGIKIMGFVGQAGESRGKIVAHGFSFTGGVLVSFWILAAVLLILRSGGNQLGWGFQLQSPGFVLALTLLLLAFALNMSGLFEVGQSAVGVGSTLTGKGGLAGSFFSGVLATVVATPCAAPFLAPALGAALALPPLASLLVFTAIGLGLSTPYLLLSAFPGMLKLLPRPGAWMETFKQAMGFLLYATVAYLLWVLAGQLTDEGGYSAFSFLKVLLSLVVLACALWIYGRYGAFHKPRKTRFLAVASSLALLLVAFLTGFSGTRAHPDGAAAVQWEHWEPGKAEDLAASGRIVYVDFTARWCVTCQTNKAAVFSSTKVLQRLKELEVVLLKADWTQQDPRISQALAAYDRSAVPFNLVYAPGRDPLILPEILTPGIVLNALDELSQ